jgi:hypothetical protein
MTRRRNPLLTAIVLCAATLSIAATLTVPPCLKEFSQEIQKGAGRLPTANARRLFKTVRTMPGQAKLGVVAVMASPSPDVGYEEVDQMLATLDTGADAMGALRANDLFEILGGLTKTVEGQLRFVPGVDDSGLGLARRLARDTDDEGVFGAAGEAIGARYVTRGNYALITEVGKRIFQNGVDREIDLLLDSSQCSGAGAFTPTGGLQVEVKHSRNGIQGAVPSKWVEQFRKDVKLHGESGFRCLQWVVVHYAGAGQEAVDREALRSAMLAVFSDSDVVAALGGVNAAETARARFELDFARIVTFHRPRG